MPIQPLLAVLLALVLPTPAGEPVRVAAVNRTATNWAVYIADDQGDFAREGLNVSLSVAGSSSRLTQQLLDGDVDVGHMAAGNVIEAVDRGEDLFIVMGLNRPVFTLVTAPHIARLEDLRGKRIGVDNVRTGYVHLVRTILQERGIDEGEYGLSEPGGVDARYDALLSGAVHAALLSPPRDQQAIAQGYRALTTLEMPAERYTGSVAVARRSWAERNRASLVAYIRAYRRAVDRLYDPGFAAAAIDVLARRLEIPTAVARTIHQDAIQQHRWLLQDGVVHKSGLRAVLRDMSSGEAAPAGLDRYIDTSYYTEAMRGRSR